MSTEPPDLYAYLDYRAFLRDWLKANHPRLSQRRFATRVECSPSLITAIGKGERDIARPLASAMAREMKLDPEATAYWHDLVTHEQAENLEERRKARARLHAARAFRQAPRIADATAMVFSRWYLPAIVELARCDGFQADPEWIASVLVPRITAGQAEEALDALRVAGFLVERDGKLESAQPIWTTDHQAGRSAALHEQHRWVLSRAAEALTEFGKTERYFGTASIAVPRDRLPELFGILTRMEEEVLSRFGANLDQVYQVSVQAFPLSKPTVDRSRP